MCGIVCALLLHCIDSGGKYCFLALLTGTVADVGGTTLGCDLKISCRCNGYYIVKTSKNCSKIWITTISGPKE